jgi:hypothetical protein
MTSHRVATQSGTKAPKIALKYPPPLVGEGWGEGYSRCPGLNCYPSHKQTIYIEAIFQDLFQQIEI